MTLVPQYDTIPAEMAAYPQWVVWRAERRGDKMTKVPYRVNGQGRADVTLDQHWSSFEDACAATGYDGIGFVLTVDDPFCAVDLDHCTDEHGTIVAWAQTIIEELDSYTEWSPSGEGIRIVVRGRLTSDAGNRRGQIEVYDHDRYVTITGQRVWDDYGTEVVDRQVELDQFHQTHFNRRTPKRPPVPSDLPVRSDTEVLQLAGNEPLWAALHSGDDSAFGGDASAGDHVFCKILCRVTGDDDQVDRLYRNSPRMRPKWDSRRGSSTYGSNTVMQARLAVANELDPSVDLLAGPDGYGFHDVGNAQRLINTNPLMRWVAEWNAWYVYERGRWVQDHNRSRVEQMASDLAGPLVEHLSAAMDETTKAKQLRSWYRYTKSATGARNAVYLAKTMDETRISFTELDQHPWLLNTPNRTIDLHTGYARDHDPNDLLIKQTAVRYDPTANAPQWEQFLQTVLPDPAVRGYVQQLLGLALIGDPQELLPILWGDGANGKTTLTEVVATVLGDYATKASQDLLIQQTHASHPTSKTSLLGVRFAHSGEINERDRLNESLVKELTGGDTITARRMHEDFWEFKPSHLLWLHANHRPVITGTDGGIWRRVKLIPFEVTIPKDERIDGYSRMLVRSEGSGILNWLLRGLGDYRRNGYKLAEPPAVVEATAYYRQQADTVSLFIESADLQFGDRLAVPAGQLDMAHFSWYSSSSVRLPVEVHSKMVKAELRRRGCEPVQRKINGKNTSMWIGCGLPSSTLV